LPREYKDLAVLLLIAAEPETSCDATDDGA